MTARVFVYGSLRRDVRNSMFHLLAMYASFMGRASLQGRLFDLGEYPGAVLCRTAGDRVQGELYLLDDPSETLARLDDYEGCGPDDPEPHEFKRVETNVLLEPGREERAWVYLYAGSTSGRPRIETGDWAALSNRAIGRGSENTKARKIGLSGFPRILPAVTYSPTQFPVQYHRRKRA